MFGFGRLCDRTHARDGIEDTCLHAGLYVHMHMYVHDDDDDGDECCSRYSASHRERNTEP